MDSGAWWATVRGVAKSQTGPKQLNTRGRSTSEDPATHQDGQVGRVGLPSSRLYLLGTPPVVQRLRLCLPIQGVWVRSLVEEVRSHMPCGQKKKPKHQTQATL